MLRDPSLIPLSHQHQHALALCVRLDRALQAGTVDLGTWQLELRQLYAEEIQFHFLAEEEVVFPAARRFPELADLTSELSSEHERLRQYFARSDQEALDQNGLEELVRLLAGHIRKEERELFEAIQKQMPGEALKSLGGELERALENAVHVCRLVPQRGNPAKNQ